MFLTLLLSTSASATICRSEWIDSKWECITPAVVESTKQAAAVEPANCHEAKPHFHLTAISGKDVVVMVLERDHN